MVAQETKVGRTLSDLTTRRVIMLVMSILISVPVFSVDTFVDTITSFDSGME